MKHNLYILKSYGKNSKELIKFGYSSNIENRISYYFLHNPFIEVLFTFYRKDALYFEKKFHKENNSLYKNEWYDINILDKLIFQIKNSETIEKNNFKKKRSKPKFYEIPDFQDCYNCKINKNINEFHKNSWKKTFHSKLCKECSVVKNKEYRQIKKAGN